MKEHNEKSFEEEVARRMALKEAALQQGKGRRPNGPPKPDDGWQSYHLVAEWLHLSFLG